MLACESFDGEHVWHTGERFRRMLNKAVPQSRSE
jgi:hypothetical protein